MATKQNICVLELANGAAPLIIRANPTPEEIQTFVLENNRRAENGFPEHELDGQPASRVVRATVYTNEAAWLAGKKGKLVDLAFADAKD